MQDEDMGIGWNEVIEAIVLVLLIAIIFSG